MKEQKALWIKQNLREGEIYAGIILGKNGDPDHHLILLPSIGDKRIPWKTAMKAAKDSGGDLPTRREQSLLFANCKEEFQPDWYWSNETYKDNAAYAWYQNFYDGGQSYGHEGDDDCRARAVRRLVIE